MNIVTLIYIVVLVVMSIVGFASMGIDKNKAKNNKWRTKEATLFLFALLGGGIGSTLGMKVFRHKTKHWYFVIGMPAIMVVQIALLIYMFIKF